MYNENHHVKAKNMPNRGSKNISPVYLNTDEIENEVILSQILIKKIES